MENLFEGRLRPEVLKAFEQIFEGKTGLWSIKRWSDICYHGMLKLVQHDSYRDLRIRRLAAGAKHVTGGSITHLEIQKQLTFNCSVIHWAYELPFF